ncbi:hypothetical protein ES332_D11G085000v1 [Gossypium tomentosum]|uniref:non-specific serine/threonine protein kinase n=1 Tax=Gossypium tomentosum TaxID=34277 RepID=A0A5D2IKW1_GOSTO|nr:hypothetical protein ES332_D11G085000v1 [Gossypium tomentosum]
MKCFHYFKDKSRSKGQRSAPELKQERKSEGYSGPDRITKSSCSTSVASPRSIPELYEAKAHNLRVFSFSELKQATRDFNLLQKIGEGGFGSVYKGTIRPAGGNGQPFEVAIKKLNKNGLQGHKQWVAEVQFLGVVEHPNLVKLIGYCAVDGERGIQRLLVYEFMQNKSLEDHLFRRAFSPLPWKTRLQIILGAAQGLAYLHEGLEVQVVGTYGYAAPDYIETGHLTDKSDVWSFGVVLYEMLSGRRSLERGRPKAEQKLLDWVKQFPPDSKKFSLIMDPRLENQYSISAAREIAKLADTCLLKSPKQRPKMSEVVERVKRIIQVSGEGSAEEMESHPEASESEIKAEAGETETDHQERVSETWKRRMAHLAKLGEHVEGASRRRLMMLQRARVPALH